MRILTLLLLLIFAVPAGAEPVRFVAFGDMPYCQPTAPDRCPAEEGRVARLMAEINAARPAFSIFVGDTKGGSEICTDERVLRAFSWMTLANHPLIYTPGDNEWVDCWQDRGGRFDPLERLALLAVLAVVVVVLAKVPALRWPVAPSGPVPDQSETPSPGVDISGEVDPNRNDTSGG